MTLAEERLETQRHGFVSHLKECEVCRGFNHSGQSMSNLCYTGTLKYLALVDAENRYIKQKYKIPARPNSTLRKRALESVLS